MEKRPWGSFEILESQPDYKIKRITVNPQHRLSYQFHDKRDEVWIIVSGRARVIIDGDTLDLSYGDTIQIPRKAKHRIANTTSDKLIFIEVQTGDYFGEDDITRILDDYFRI